MLKEYITQAEQEKVAIGHFNFATLDGLWAIFNAMKALSMEIEHPFGPDGIPVVVGVAEGERAFLGAHEVALIVRYMRETYNYPIFLNADHTYSVDLIKEAIDAGYDMVIYDGAQLSFDENVRYTKEAIEYRNAKKSSCLVEGELGFIGVGSTIRDTLPEGVGPETMTKPEEAKRFVEMTGIDLLAPSIGNIHGMVKSGNPALDANRVFSLRPSAGVPLVLHGGSGSSDEDFKKVISAGISLIHISTELRVTYRTALEKSLKENDSVAPYKYLTPARDAMMGKVKERAKLFLGK